MPIPYSGYPPPKLDSAEEDEAPIRKGNPEKKGGNVPPTQKGSKAKRDNGSDVEDESDSAESSDSDQFNRIDEASGGETSSDEDGSDSRSALELELESVSERKAPSFRKPSKRAVETALNEVS